MELKDKLMEGWHIRSSGKTREIMMKNQSEKEKVGWLVKLIIITKETLL